MTSRCRQNYSEESEALVNKQINFEMHASYVYLSMSSWCSRDDVALHGFSKYFMQASDEERGHAKSLMEYQSTRGGRVVFQDVTKPSSLEWRSALEAIKEALEMEKTINQSLLTMHTTADSKKDPHLTNYLEETFLTEQVTAIKKFGDLITKMERAGDGLGVHIIDKELMALC